jgi:hypothetical protein
MQLAPAVYEDRVAAHAASLSGLGWATSASISERRWLEIEHSFRSAAAFNAACVAGEIRAVTISDGAWGDLPGRA